MSPTDRVSIWSRLQSLGLLTFPAMVAGVAVMPVFALGPLAFAIRQDFDFSTTDLGVTFCTYFICSAVFTPVGGWLSSRFAISGIVRTGLLFSSALAAAVAFAEGSSFLIATSLVGGIVFGLVTPAMNILIADLVPKPRRGLAFGLKVAAMPAAASLAALSAYSAATFGTGWQMVFWSSAGVGCVVAAFSSSLRSDPPPPVVRRRGSGTRRPPRSLRLLGIGGFLAAAGTATVPAFLVEGLIAHGEAPGDAAGLFAVSGWLGIAARIIVGAISDKFPRPRVHLRVAAAMIFAGSVGMVGFALGGTRPVLVASSLLVFGFGWSWPGLLHYAALVGHPKQPARATSYMQTGTAIGSLLGPLLFGLIAASGSFTWAWGISAAWVFLGAGFVLTGAQELGRPHRGLANPQ